MPTQQKARSWARSLQRAETPTEIPVRGHYGAATEQGSRIAARQLPKDFGERIREQKVFRTPGLDEALEHSDSVIEDWKRSL